MAQKKRVTTHHENDPHRLVEMAWEDKITFDEIKRQFGITENQLKNLMRRLTPKSSYKRWRKRVQGRRSKHQRNLKMTTSPPHQVL